jgi:hypothetical protein
VITRLLLIVDDADERNPAMVVFPVRDAPLIAGDVPNTSEPLPVSSESSPEIPADVVNAVKAPLPLPLRIPVSDVAPVPPLPTASADARVSTPAEENVDVAVDPKYA